MKNPLPLALVVAVSAVLSAQGQFTVTQMNGSFSTNYSTLPTSTAFGRDEIGGGGLAIHKIPNIRDGVYGNDSSWIGDSQDSFVGISFGTTPLSVGQFAFGRDSTGTYSDRTAGTYTLQFTTVPNPNASTPEAAWTTIGSLTQSQDDAGLYSSSRRHAFNFTPVSATGMRLIAPGSSFVNGADIDELEFAPFAPAPLTLQTVGSTMNFATNIALVTNGGVPFAKDLLQNGAYLEHTIPHLNDGLYGNAQSWIGDSEDSFAGVRFAAPSTIGRVAFGRDNTGQFGDRADGYYLVQYTRAANPSATTPESDWFDIGPAFVDAVAADRGLRHEYSFAPVAGATGLRVISGGNGIATGRAIDELEVYAAPIPEPGTASLALAGLVLLARRRRG